MDEDNGLLTTDEAILNSMGEGDEPTTSDGTEEEDSGTEENASGQTSTASSDQNPDGSSTTEQQEQSRGPQDLVDANGNVIAAGGKERRFYETAQREKQRADQVSNELNVVKSQMEAVNNAGTVGTQYGLSPEEVTTGAQLIAAYKNNPVEAIQYMLTQAQSNGHNVDGITSGGTDMQAVKQMLDNALAPILGEQQERVDSQEAQDRAETIYNEFNSKYPDSAVHEDSLTRLLQQEPSLNVEAAYYKLQSYYASRGLDWTKSLAQLQQEQESQPQQQQARVNAQPQPPEGGGVTPNLVTDTAQVADISTSTDDIIRQAMSEAGIN
jgi:hypothetical protein|tara:strand:- start:1485 stop:2459 length:975 start_codon:yes stop_codon:yes gene_type:complete